MRATLRHGGFRVEVLPAPGPEWQAREEELSAAGVALPLPHRMAWSVLAPHPSWLVAVHEGAGRCRAAFALQVSPSRALPGHLLLRTERLGGGGDLEATEAGLHAVAALVRRHPRVLRVYLELFSAEPETLAALGRGAAAAGFQSRPCSRTYDRTILIDLEPGEEEIFAGLHRTARRHVRAVEKHPVEIRPITDAAYGGRMEELLRETLARTGGRHEPRCWHGVIELGRLHPSLSRLVGLFRTDRTGPEALLAFAWGCGHGDSAHYSTAASTRRTDLRMPLLYGLAWDLIRWAKRNGARHFDFGGVTAGGCEDEPLGGISDFKRYFSTRQVEVGREWVLEPRPVRAGAARLLSDVSAWLSRVRA